MSAIAASNRNSNETPNRSLNDHSCCADYDAIDLSHEEGVGRQGIGCCDVDQVWIGIAIHKAKVFAESFFNERPSRSLIACSKWTNRDHEDCCLMPQFSARPVPDETWHPISHGPL